MTRLIDLFKPSIFKSVNKPESYEQWCQRLRNEYAELTQSPNLNPFDSQAERVYSARKQFTPALPSHDTDFDLASLRIRNREDSAYDRWIEQRSDCDERD